MHLVFFDQLLRFGFGDGWLPCGVAHEKLNFSPGNHVAALLEKEIKSVLHLLSAGRQSARLDGQEADTDGRFIRSLRRTKAGNCKNRSGRRQKQTFRHMFSS